MVDLRSSAAHLIAHPLVPVPPVEGVVARARRYRAARLRKQMGASVALLALVLTAVVRAGVGGGGGPDSLRMVGDPPWSEEAPVGGSGRATTTLPSDLSPFIPWSGQNFAGDWSRLQSKGTDCPDRLTGSMPAIKLMANRPSAEVAEVVDTYNNFLGGICGRAIKLIDGVLCNPHWADTVKDPDLVAVVGMPLDEDLDSCAESGELDRFGIPVVGGDGLSAAQHNSPLVYPVGTSAAALTRMELEHARANGAQNFTIVYDSSRRFAREAAHSFTVDVQRTRGTVKESIDLSSSASDLATASERYRRACGDGACDFVFLALEDHAARKWLQTRPAAPRLETAALPTLLSGGFPKTCFRTSNERCNGLVSWTGFVPWFGQELDAVEDVHGGNIVEAEASAMVESATRGTLVLIEALEKAGPSVTRTSLRTVLDGGGYRLYPTAPLLEWGPQLPRVGNPVAQPWRVVVDDAGRWSSNVGVWFEGNVATWSNIVASWPPALRAWAAETPKTWPEDVETWMHEAISSWPRASQEWVALTTRMWPEAMKAWANDRATAVRAWSTTRKVWEGELPPLAYPPSTPWPAWLTQPPGPGIPMTPPGPRSGLDTPLPKQGWEAGGTGWRRDPAGP